MQIHIKNVQNIQQIHTIYRKQIKLSKKTYTTIY